MDKGEDFKARIGLIPEAALLDEAAVMTFGATKHGEHDWRQGYAWSKLIDATLRHIVAFNAGEDNDSESGLPHLAHARCNLGFLLEYAETHPELDDRYVEPAEVDARSERTANACQA